MASEVLMSISKDEAERWRLMSEYKYELDMQSKRVHAERTGHAKGLAKGRAEGLAKGRAEGLAEAAPKLKNMGLSPEQIMEATGVEIN